MAHSWLGLCIHPTFLAALTGCWGSAFSSSTLTSTSGDETSSPQAENLPQGSLSPAFPRDGSTGSTRLGTYPQAKAALAGAATLCRAEHPPSHPPSSHPQHPSSQPAALAPLPMCQLASAPFPGSPSPAPTLACPTASFGKDISGVLLLDSHFLRINGLIDADSLQKRSGGVRGVRWERFRLLSGAPHPLRPPGSAGTCRCLGPIQVPGLLPVPAGCCPLPDAFLGCGWHPPGSAAARTHLFGIIMMQLKQ